MNGYAFGDTQEEVVVSIKEGKKKAAKRLMDS